jgi:hypothetical protein
MCLSNIEKIQKESVDLLLSSGWEETKVDALVQCLMDFTSQAFSDGMYKDAKVELYDDEQTLDIFWKTDHLNVRVILYDDISAQWNLFAGKIVDGVEVESESSGVGGNSRFTEYDGCVTEDDKWAFHFYWWLEDYLNA